MRFSRMGIFVFSCFKTSTASLSSSISFSNSATLTTGSVLVFLKYGNKMITSTIKTPSEDAKRSMADVLKTFISLFRLDINTL